MKQQFEIENYENLINFLSRSEIKEYLNKNIGKNRLIDDLLFYFNIITSSCSKGMIAREFNLKWIDKEGSISKNVIFDLPSKE